MTERLFKIDPKNPNSNLHGVTDINGGRTCLTQKGKMCTACCNALNIKEGRKIVKEAGEDCHARIPTKGCAYILTSQPTKRLTVCPLYHCSSDRRKAKEGDLAAWQRLMIENAAAQKASETTKAEAKENEVFRIGKQPIEIKALTEPDGMYTSGDEEEVDRIAQWLIENGQ